MIETVSTSSVQGGALRSLPQASVSAPAPQPTSKPSESYTSSRIRMDNLLDMAILEFRNWKSGAVIQQYPTESQIRAFQRASELEPKESSGAAPAPAHSFDFVEVAPQAQSAAPASPAPSAPVASSDGAQTTQSVLV